MPDWMDQEVRVQHRRQEKAKGKEERKWHIFHEKMDEINALALPVVPLLEKMISEFCTQTGWFIEWQDNDHVIDGGWRYSRYHVNKYRETRSDNTATRYNNKFHICLLARERFFIFGPKVWVEFRYIDERWSYKSKHFSVPPVESAIKSGLRRAFRKMNKDSMS